MYDESLYKWNWRKREIAHSFQGHNMEMQSKLIALCILEALYWRLDDITPSSVCAVNAPLCFIYQFLQSEKEKGKNNSRAVYAIIPQPRHTPYP